MSVALTNCGQAGWVTDRSGYRYDPVDPVPGRQCPAIPTALTGVRTDNRRLDTTAQTATCGEILCREGLLKEPLRPDAQSHRCGQRSNFAKEYPSG